MLKSCPNCGAEIIPGARFCRLCGGPIRMSEGGDGTGEVSPQSPTIPLHDEARTTDGLGDSVGERVSNDTSRVGNAELERLLRSRDEAIKRTPEATPSSTPDRDASGDMRASHETRPGTDARNATGAHDPEATLIASPASTRPGVTVAGFEDDDELTISVPRPVQTLDTRESSALHEAGDEASLSNSAAAPPHESARDNGHEAGAHPSMHASVASSPLVPSKRVAPSSPVPPARRRSRWPLIAAASVALLLFAVAGVWLAVRLLRRPPLTDLSTQSPTAPAVPDALQQFDAKLAEAESLLAQGNMDGAVARLREANALDPANTRAHRRLGELLLASGARREAIEEFRAVTRNTPDDFTAWRQLAVAQFAEGLHRDAAESYKRLIELVGEQSADANDLLAYADALRLSGRTEESRAIYERLAASAQGDVAGLAQQHLAELPKPQQSPTPPTRSGETAGAQNQDGDDIAQAAPSQTAPVVAPPAPPPDARPQPTPVSSAPATGVSPAEHYRRGVELWSSNRSAALGEFRAARSPDADFYLGLSYVEGRDMRSLKRAEVVAALQLFQNAQRGQFAQRARGYAQQLEKEFDRLRKQ